VCVSVYVCVEHECWTFLSNFSITLDTVPNTYTPTFPNRHKAS